MTTHTIDKPLFGAERSSDAPVSRRSGVLRLIAPLGRLFFSAIFLLSVPNHFADQTIQYAAHAGVPLANIVVPASGVLELIGALSVLVGFHARIGAWLLVLFLVPVTILMHRFWGIVDPQMATMQQINFLKNVSLLGGALLVTYFGAGPFSLDARTPRRHSVPVA